LTDHIFHDIMVIVRGKEKTNMTIFGWILVGVCILNILISVGMADSGEVIEFTSQRAVINLIVNTMFIIYILKSLNIL